MKLRELLEAMTEDQIQDIVDDAFIDLYGEVPNGPGYYDIVNRVKHKKPKDTDEAMKIIGKIVSEHDFNDDQMEWSWEDEPKNIKQVKAETKKIKSTATKLPKKKLKLEDMNEERGETAVLYYTKGLIEGYSDALFRVMARKIRGKRKDLYLIKMAAKNWKNFNVAGAKKILDTLHDRELKVVGKKL